jgi:hypothetical protein
MPRTCERTRASRLHRFPICVSIGRNKKPSTHQELKLEALVVGADALNLERTVHLPMTKWYGVVSSEVAMTWKNEYKLYMEWTRAVDSILYSAFQTEAVDREATVFRTSAVLVIVGGLTRPLPAKAERKAAHKKWSDKQLRSSMLDKALANARDIYPDVPEFLRDAVNKASSS